MKIYNVDQGSDEWSSLRAGKPTAFNFKMLVTSKGEASKQMPTLAATLAGEMFAGKPLDQWGGNKWTERGTELEDDARMKYAVIKNVVPDIVGFITDDDEKYGCSPDSLVGDDGMVEIKCLKAENHIKAIMYYDKNQRIPTDYVQQVQGQMMIAERQWCDLVFYHPDLPILIVRNHPIMPVVSGLRRQLAAVLEERDKILTTLNSYGG